MGILSNGFNIALPIMFITNDTTIPKALILSQVRTFNIYRLCVPITFFIVFLVFFKEKPNTKDFKEKAEKLLDNTNQTENVQSVDNKKFIFKTYIKTFREMYSNRAYVYLNISYTCIHGVGGIYFHVAPE